MADNRLIIGGAVTMLIMGIMMLSGVGMDTVISISKINSEQLSSVITIFFFCGLFAFIVGFFYTPTPRVRS